METSPEKRLMFTVREFIIILFSVCSVVFSGTLIYSRFQSMESNIYDIKTKIDYVDGRIDRKVKHIADQVDELKKELKNGKSTEGI